MPNVDAGLPTYLQYTPSWSNTLQDAQSQTILEGMPWLWIAPGLMIALALLSINFIGDGLRDALDPLSTL